MMERVSDLKEPRILFSQDNENLNSWNNMNRKLIPKIIDGLKPFETGNKISSLSTNFVRNLIFQSLQLSSQRATIGDVIPLIKWLLNEIKEGDNQSGLKSMMKALRDQLMMPLWKLIGKQKNSFTSAL